MECRSCVSRLTRVILKSEPLNLSTVKLGLIDETEALYKGPPPGGLSLACGSCTAEM